MGRKALGKTKVLLTVLPESLAVIDQAAKIAEQDRSTFMEEASTKAAKRIIAAKQVRHANERLDVAAAKRTRKGAKQ